MGLHAQQLAVYTKHSIVCHSSITAGPSGMDAPRSAPRPCWLTQAVCKAHNVCLHAHPLSTC